jgi:hypothetical protein
MAEMAERQKEWQNGRMAEMATYILFMVHANDDDTLIFYIADYLAMVMGDNGIDNYKKIRQIDGNFDHHATWAIRRDAHRPMERIRCFM